MARKVSVAAIAKPDPEPRTYFGVDSDLPEIFFKTAEQIAEEEWKELWTIQR